MRYYPDDYRTNLFATCLFVAVVAMFWWLIW